MMTTPHERTKAVTDTRELLQMLASAEEITIRGLVQSVALGLLRHYPLDVDLEVSAAALPVIWATPEQQHTGSTVAPECQTRIPGRRDADDIRKRPNRFGEWLFHFASSQKNIDRVAMWLGGTICILGAALAVTFIVMLLLR
jgi:hypothetical protein